VFKRLTTELDVGLSLFDPNQYKYSCAIFLFPTLYFIVIIKIKEMILTRL